jgi:hypothetical protein
MPVSKRTIFIDPSYPAYYEDRLFDIADPVLNRDGTLMPFDRLRAAAEEKNIGIHTADYLMEGKIKGAVNEYYSLGLLENYPKLTGRQDGRLRGFFILEPPVVAPKLYRALPELTRHFEQVYLHNTEGDGYSLKGVDRSRLRKLYWPQPLCDVMEPWWGNRDRLKRIVVINGNHIPRSFRGQLYGKRIEAMAHLAKQGVVDLYGRGWDQWWSHRSMWPPYWWNYRALMSIYQGSCESKYQVLSRYRFSLCFENMAMQGYVTEKIFDCFYAGAIPLYLGAKDISSLIPEAAYVDCRRFSSWEEMGDKVMSLSDKEVADMREAGRAFIQSDDGMRYYNSLLGVLHE